MTTATAPDFEKQPVKPAEIFISPSPRRKITNAVAGVLVSIAVLIALIPLVWVLGTVIARGLPSVLDPTWWQNSQRGVPGSSVGGGAYHAIMGTIITGAITSILSIPLAIFVAIYLVEYGNKSLLARVTTFMVDILSGVPSVVAALFIYAFWVTTFGFDRSALAVSFALVLLMVPVVVRSTEEMLRIVPDDLREASYALGVPKWKTIARIVIPTALPGIITGVMLAIARVLGESAPVIILIVYARAISTDPLSGAMGTLPGMMFDARTLSGEPRDYRIWGAALTLIVLIALLNIVGKAIARYARVR